MTDEEKFNLQVPLGLHRMLQYLGETQNPRLKVSVFARHLLETYLENDSLNHQQEKKQLSLRLSKSVKETLEQKESEYRSKTSGKKANVSKFVRQILIHGVREELLKRTVDEKEIKRFWSILMNWGFTFTLLIGMLGMGYWTHGFRQWGNSPSQEHLGSEVQLRNVFENDGDKSAAFDALNTSLYQAFIERGIFLFEEGQYIAAIKDFRQALEIQSTDMVLSYLARAHKQIGEDAEAESYLKRLEQPSIQQR